MKNRKKRFHVGACRFPPAAAIVPPVRSGCFLSRGISAGDPAGMPARSTNVRPSARITALLPSIHIIIQLIKLFKQRISLPKRYRADMTPAGRMPGPGLRQLRFALGSGPPARAEPELPGQSRRFWRKEKKPSAYPAKSFLHICPAGNENGSVTERLQYAIR